MNGRLFESIADYELALLRLLHSLPYHRGHVADILGKFDERYGRHIPDGHREGRPGKRSEPLWAYRVHLGRHGLWMRGFLAPSQRGVWCLGEEGVRWAEQHPDADRLPPITKAGARRISRSAIARERQTQRGFDVTLEMLERTRTEMPEDLFNEIWGGIFEQVLAQERAKAVTPLSAREAGNRAMALLDQVHAFLKGESDQRPTCETLCDWIHFCFAIDLHREAATLARYIAEEEIDPAIYRRAKRLADASRARLGW